MTTPILSQIHEIENIFPQMEDKPLLFECEMLILKKQIRAYCQEKGYYSHTANKEVKS
jgi:hypothetical protein